MLNSSDCDMVYTNNITLFSNNDNTGLPYLVSQGLIKDLSLLLPEFAPAIQDELRRPYNYMEPMKVGSGLYGIPTGWPFTEMLVAMIKKALISSDSAIQISAACTNQIWL